MLGAQMAAFIVDFGNLTFKFKRIEYWPIQWTVGQDYRGWSPADGMAFLLAKWIQLYFHLQWGCLNKSMGFKEHLNMTSVLSSHFSPALSGWPSCSRFGWKLLLLDFSVKIFIFLWGISIMYNLLTIANRFNPQAAKTSWLCEHLVWSDRWNLWSVKNLEENEGRSLLWLNCDHIVWVVHWSFTLSLCYLSAETEWLSQKPVTRVHPLVLYRQKLKKKITQRHCFVPNFLQVLALRIKEAPRPL